MRVVLADPPAFTPPYDHELAAALARAGADVELLTSRFRFGERPAPDGYRLDDEDLRVYRDAVRLGYVSACRRLDRVDFEPLQDLTLTEVRATIGLEEDLLRAYYAIERRRFPNSPESQRLLD